MQRNIDDRMFAFAGVLFLALAFILTVYYAVTVPVEKSFGERYVNAEIPLLFPFYLISSFKPITLITYLIFAGVICVLEGKKNFLSRFDLRGLRIVLLFVTFSSGYEVLWNFYAWFTTWERIGGILDLAVNSQHEYNHLPANFNFATKISFLVFALALYGLSFLWRSEKDKRSADHS